MHSTGDTLNTVDHSFLSQLSFLAHPEMPWLFSRWGSLH